MKIAKIYSQITIAAWMQPLQYDLRSSAANDNSTTHAAAAPSNLDAAITMRFAASRGKPASLYTHGNTRLQQSCSHSTAICNHRFRKRIERRTQEQPLLAEHRGGTNFAAFPSSPLPFLTTSLRHHFPSSPLPFVTTSLPHHFPS